MSYTRTAQMLEKLGVLNSLDRFSLDERFNRKPNINADLASGTEATREPSNPDFEVLGTNASSDDVTFGAAGGVKCETDGASADQVIVLPHLDTVQTAWSGTTWGTDQETAWVVVMTTGSSIALTTLWTGLKLTNTSVTATDANQAFFRYEPGTNSGKWECNYSVAGTDYQIDSGVTVLADTTYVLAIWFDSTRNAHFFIDGEEVIVGTNAMTTAIDLIPYWGVQADTAAAKHAYLRRMVISRKYSAE